MRAAGTVDPLLGYTVPAPTISSLQDGDTSFSGNVNIAGAPAGTSFIVFVVDSSGTPIAQANNVDGSGNFSGTLTNGASFKAGETYHFTAVVQRQADGDPNPFTNTAVTPLLFHNQSHPLKRILWQIIRCQHLSFPHSKSVIPR